MLEFSGGTVTLIAENVPTGEILARWAARGNTRIVNVAQLAGPIVSLELRNVPERVVLDILLRPFAGHVASMREGFAPGQSAFDRIMILPASRPPLNTRASVTAADEPAPPADAGLADFDGDANPSGSAPPARGFQPAATGVGPPVGVVGPSASQRGTVVPAAVPQPTPLSPFNSTGQGSTRPTVTAAPYPASAPPPPPPVVP